MNYEEKYKQALEIAKECLQDCTITTIARDYILEIFPELKEKESEDERIRQELCDFLRDNMLHQDAQYFISWLERQKDYIKFLSSAYTSNKDVTEFADKYSHIVWEKLMNNFKKIENYSIGCNDVSDIVLNAIINTYIWLEGQGKIFNADDWYVSKVDGKIHNAKFIEKQDEKKPTNKPEPKFKLGDWIIFNGLILHIDEIVNGYYRTTSRGDDTHNSYDWDIDNAARLWTIQEAKDGDVLVNWNNTTFIFKAIENKTVKFHIAYNERLNTIATPLTKLSHQGLAEPQFEFHPATKEQCDTLFAKMKEAGYGWNNERKELKKIEQNPADKSKFKVGDWFVNNNRKDVFLIKSIDANGYCTLEDIKGNIISPCLPPCESDSHIWTINDAKDGDVLVAKDNRPFIFTGEFDVQDDNPTAYCGINSSDKFITGKGSHWTFKDGIKPATKELRELLFSKMKEAGCEWDSVYKKLAIL